MQNQTKALDTHATDGETSGAVGERSGEVTNEQPRMGSGEGLDAAHPLEMVAVSSLTGHPRNYRRHPEDQIDHLAKSLQEHGFYRPVVVADDNIILAGHGIVQAAKRLGWATVPVIRVPIPSYDPKALKILTGDNELGRLAEIDDRALSELLKEIKDTDGLLGTGFDPLMLANLVMVTRPQSEIADIDEAAEWAGLPGYEAEDKPVQAIVSFDSEEDRLRFMQVLGLDAAHMKRTRSWSLWWPAKERQDLSSLRFEESRDD